MFKSILVSISIISISFPLVSQSAISKKLTSIDENAKETATGQDKTPWQSKPAPPDVVMKSTSKKSVKAAKDKALKQKEHAIGKGMSSHTQTPAAVEPKDADINAAHTEVDQSTR